jgi:ribosomal protein S8E
MKAMQEYQKDLYKHSTSAQKKEAVKMVKQILSESLDEAYDGKISDFKYDLEMALEEIGFNSKAIKKVSKVGKNFEVRMSSYMSQRATWEKIGELMGATLVEFKPDPRSINVGIYESVNEDSFMKTDRTAAAISNVIQLDKKVIKKFIEDNNLDANKIHTFVQKKYPKNAESFVQLMKHPNNSSLKNFTNESVNEEKVDMTELENTLKRVKKENPGKKVGYIFVQDAPKGYKISIDGKYTNESFNEGAINEGKTSLDDMMKWIEKSMKFVKTSEEFNGNDGGIWVSGENGDRYKGKQIYDYYIGDPKNYELGVLKDWEKELNKRGWYSEWYDAGTVMIWPD